MGSLLCTCVREDLVISDVKYAIISKIADGGFGVISLVENTRDGKQYALKQIKCESRKEADVMLLENKYYNRLNSHSNLIKLIGEDLKEDRRLSTFTIYSVFPYYKAGTLQDELESNLKANTFIEQTRLCQIFYGICDGTSFIHESNLAHRDLKPHNVLMSNDRQTPVLTDYGSMTARVLEVQDQRKCQEVQDWAAQNCSMFYRAPEFFEPRVDSWITEKADIWSLGCILYAMMYNKGPFDYVCEKGDSIAMAVSNGNYKFSSEQLSQRSERLVSLVKEMVMVDDYKRSSLETVMNELKECEVPVLSSSDVKIA